MSLSGLQKAVARHGGPPRIKEDPMAHRQEPNWRSRLNDLNGRYHLDIAYSEESIGPSHAEQWIGRFTMNTMTGFIMIGLANATNKKDAKELAAAIAVQYLNNMGYV